MHLAFTIIAALTVGSALAAMTLRNLVHCALSLTMTFAGLAALYLQLNAEFVGFAQILVYVGAVSILIVFAILLTRNSDAPGKVSIATRSWGVGLVVALAVFGCLVGAVIFSTKIHRELPSAPIISAKKIGLQLLGNYVLPLEVIGLLLTAAMIGAAIIAMPDKSTKKSKP